MMKSFILLGYTDDSDFNKDVSYKFGLNLFISLGPGVEKTVGTGKAFLQSTVAFPATSVAGSNTSAE